MTSLSTAVGSQSDKDFNRKSEGLRGGKKSLHYFSPRSCGLWVLEILRYVQPIPDASHVM
jgi:hypothetical protein